MGTGTSRGKRVAPVRDADVTQAGADKRDGHAFKPRRIHTILRTVARKRAPADSHSDGHDSECSAEEEDPAVDAELGGTVLPGYEGRGRAKPPSKKTFARSRSYGLCSFSGADTDDDCGSAAAESRSATRTRGSRGAPTPAVNNDAFTHCQTHTAASDHQHNASAPGFLSRGAFLEAVPTSEKQSPFGSYSPPPVSMPVILYDGSEEELMDTIEREFS